MKNSTYTYIVAAWLAGGALPAAAQVPADSVRTGTQPADTITHRLREAEVRADRIKTYADHQEVYLSEENRRYGNNALDAISSLPMFRTMMGNEQLTTPSGTQVALFMNGRRASAEELRALTGEQILKVKYYTQPPARYAARVSGPMIEIVTRRARDRQYVARAETDQALTAFTSRLGLSLAMTDSLNYLVVSNTARGRKYDDFEAESIYRYGTDSYSRYYTDEGLYKNKGNSTQAVYQRTQGKHTFYTQGAFSYFGDVFRNRYAATVNESGAALADGEQLYRLQTTERSVQHNAYYAYDFTPGRSLSLDVVNAYSYSASNNDLTLGLPAPYEHLNYDIANRTQNKVYSLLTQASYNTGLWGGQAGINAYFAYRRLRQQNRGSEDMFSKSLYYSLYATYGRNIGRTGINAMAGVNALTQHTASQRQTTLSPSVRLNANTPVARGVNLRWQGQAFMTNPGIGNLAASPSAIDRRYYAMGNPELKPYTSWGVAFMPVFFTADYKLYAEPTVSYYYRHNVYMPVLTKQGELFVKQQQNVGNGHYLYLNANATYAPLKWLRIQAWYGLTKMDYHTPTQHVYKPLSHYGTLLELTFGEFTLNYYLNARNKQVDGDFSTWNDWMHVAQVNWTRRAVSLSCRFDRACVDGSDYAAMPGFSYESHNSLRPYRHFFTLKFVYTFTKGKSRNRRGKRINNTETDTGLTNDNRPNVM